MKHSDSKETLNIEIIDATPDDVRGIREVQYKTWLATYPNEELGIIEDDIHDRFKDSLEDEKIKEREERIRNLPEGQKYTVAKNDGKIVGFAISTKHEDKNQLRAIYVLPEFQGTGVGKKLWEQACQIFDTTKDTIVEVASYNSSAIEFYKKLGFEETGQEIRDETFKMKSGAILPETVLIKKAEQNKEAIAQKKIKDF